MDTLLINARLPYGRTGCAIAINAGRIAAILPPGAPLPDAAATHDLAGDLVLPALVDGHMHLDKTLWGQSWFSHAAEPNRASRIATDFRVLSQTELPVSARAGALLQRCVVHGTGHVRSHVDITPVLGLRPLEGVLEARAAMAGAITVQIVAFPQAGVLTRPGTLDLMQEALRLGADLLGGIDPCEIERDPRGQLDAIFALAGKHGVGLDIHLHEPGELGLFSLQEVCARTIAAGMQGNVTISHGFCLGGIAESKQKAAAALLAESDVALCSHGAGGAALPPLMLLHEAGVRVFCGNDDIRDSWSPYGTADMLERAGVIGWRLDVRHDSLLEAVFGMCSASGASALGIKDHGLQPGAAANLFTLPAENIPEAVGQHPPRHLVFHAGRLVAQDGNYLSPHAAPPTPPQGGRMGISMGIG